MIDFTTKRVMTFDCYGTLIDWETGILSTLQSILKDHGVTADAERLLALHAELESAAERGPYTSYRQLLMTVLQGQAPSAFYAGSTDLAFEGLAKSLRDTARDTEKAVANSCSDAATDRRMRSPHRPR